jgi:uncharacterized heparinase superfamily protein
VECRRIDGTGSQGFVASHDGYLSRFGLIHERELSISQEGTMVRGADRFLRPGGGAPEQAAMVAVRFHLHPDIELYRDDGGLLILAGDATDTWVFSCRGADPVVEESIFFAALAGPCRSRQIVLHFDARELPEVRWQLVRTHSILSRG